MRKYPNLCAVLAALLLVPPAPGDCRRFGHAAVVVHRSYVAPLVHHSYHVDPYAAVLRHVQQVSYSVYYPAADPLEALKSAERIIERALADRGGPAPAVMPLAKGPARADVAKGHLLLTDNCARCHTEGSPKKDAPVLFRLDGSLIDEGNNVERMARAIRERTMPPGGMSGDDRADALGHLMFLPPATAPKE